MMDNCKKGEISLLYVAAFRKQRTGMNTKGSGRKEVFFLA